MPSKCGSVVHVVATNGFPALYAATSNLTIADEVLGAAIASLKEDLAPAGLVGW